MDLHDLDHGPVLLIANDAPMRHQARGWAHIPMMRTETFTSNRAALFRASELASVGGLHMPMVVDVLTRTVIFNVLEINHLIDQDRFSMPSQAFAL